MPTTTRIPAIVHATRERLAEGRSKLRRQHVAGSPGVQLCAALTSLLDTVILDLYEAALLEFPDTADEIRSQIALVPYGGYGRCDVAPFSDVDLLVLHPPQFEERLIPLLRKFTQHIYDVGLELGFSPRTASDACSMAMKDITVFTSLAEARLLTGNSALFERFSALFRKQTKRRSRSLIEQIDIARRKERTQYGETNYLLEPHLKRSRGGLRDLQFIRWVGFAQCGEVDPDNLLRVGVLSKEDHRVIQFGREFLLRLRNELHFHANKSQDVLSKSEQMRIAALRGFPGSEGVLPVEQFMRDFFEHTSEVRYTASNYVANALVVRPMFANLLEPLVSYRMDNDFRIGPRGIRVVRSRLADIAGDPAEVMRLMELANLADKRIEHRTWSAIRDSMLKSPTSEVTPAAASKFLALLAQTARLGESLRRLHELRVLEKLIPAMSHARCLLQFNEYHKFTVDEHSIRAVEMATEFRLRSAPLGEAYRNLPRKDLLHLALLLHDLGKGYAEDHSEVGRRLADETCRFLNLPDHERELVVYLVHKHLIMSHLAQWRDINDPRVVIAFAVEVGSQEALQMLFLLTCADLAAVGPGVLTDWKLRLLSDLYQRTMNHFGGDVVGSDRMEQLRQTIYQQLRANDDRIWWNKQIEALPHSYLFSCDARQIYHELSRLYPLQKSDAIAWHRLLPEQKAVEYAVGTYEEIVPGIFHRLTGTLTAMGLQILSAEINTLADGLVLDRFYVVDGDFHGPPDPARVIEIERRLVAALKDPSDSPPAFRKVWGAQAKTRAAELSDMPTQVRIDCTSSDKFTIIDVFAHDRMGLLYTITRTLFEQGMSVGIAKIGTHLDQVVDVFYVTDFNGNKVVDDDRLNTIRHALLDAMTNLQ